MVTLFNPLDYSAEVERLRKLGWLPPEISTVPAMDELNDGRSEFVSFPKAAYETDSTNQDLESFWTQVRAEGIFKMLSNEKIVSFWEFGSGDGSVSIPLTKMGIKIFCVEPIKAGADFTSAYGIKTFCSTLENLELPNSCLNAIGIFDVLEHIRDPINFLSILNKVLEKKGKLIITVPMYQFLYSDFDISIGHFRRYSEELLKKQLDATGFVIRKKKYLFSYLLLPAFLTRRIPYLLGKRRNYATFHRGMNNQLFRAKFIIFIIKLFTKLEEILHIPFGLTLLVLAEKE